MAGAGPAAARVVPPAAVGRAPARSAGQLTLQWLRQLDGDGGAHTPSQRTVHVHGSEHKNLGHTRLLVGPGGSAGALLADYSTEAGGDKRIGRDPRFCLIWTKRVRVAIGETPIY